MASRNDRNNHGDISLIPISSKLFASTILHTFHNKLETGFIAGFECNWVKTSMHDTHSNIKKEHKAMKLCNLHC